MPWEKNFSVEQALDAAMRVFWVQGYATTSMSDLVQAMGINRGSIYDTFTGKRQLFISALKRYDGICRQRWLRQLQDRYPPRRAIQALFDGWVEMVLKDRSRRGCFLTNTALEMAAHDSEVGEMVARSQKGLERFFCDLITKGQQDGDISSTLDPADTARSLLASLIGLLVLSRSRPERRLLETISREAVAILA